MSFYSVKKNINGSPEPRTLPIGETTLTEAQLRDKNYIIRYNNDMYVIGDHTNPKNASGRRNNCKLAMVILKKEQIFVAKITVPAVKVGFMTEA